MTRFRQSFAIAGLALAAIATAAWAVHAQSPQTPSMPMPMPMPGMNHMMHHGQDTPADQHTHGTAPASADPSSADHAGHKADDGRELVVLPPAMQEHMLANMRDHLATLNTVVGDVSQGNFDSASKILEERLGMSSLRLHNAAEMAPYFPQGMQDAGTGMHRAASRLALTLQDASVAQTYDAMREVNAGLHEVTSSCVGCHAGYRMR